MNATITQSDKETVVDMIQFLEKKYQIQILEGYGIHTPDMEEYQKIQTLQTVTQMQDEERV